MSSEAMKEGPLTGKSGSADHLDHGDAASRTMLAQTKPVTLVLKGVFSEEIFIFGSWDSWQNGSKVTKSDRDDEYQIDLKLGAGRYEFKYKTATGHWFHNEDMPTTMNVFGTLNNILDVPAVPSAAKDEVASAAKDEVASAAKDEVASAVKDGVPSAAKDGVPSAAQDGVPSAAKDGVPSAAKDGVPSAKEKSTRCGCFRGLWKALFSRKKKSQKASSVS